MRPVRLDEAAEEEAAGAAEWYDDRQEGLGDRFLSAVEEGLTQLRESPEACSPVQGVPAGLPEVRRISLKGFPYGLVFAVLPTELVVVAVAHARRRPGYWIERLRPE